MAMSGWSARLLTQQRRRRERCERCGKWYSAAEVECPYCKNDRDWQQQDEARDDPAPSETSQGFLFVVGIAVTLVILILLLLS